MLWGCSGCCRPQSTLAPGGALQGGGAIAPRAVRQRNAGGICDAAGVREEHLPLPPSACRCLPWCYEHGAGKNGGSLLRAVASM